MTAFRRTAVASLMLLAFGAAANAQTVRSGYWADSYDHGPLVTGRSVYVDRAPRTNAEADETVMGLRVPNGLRYR